MQDYIDELLEGQEICEENEELYLDDCIDC